MGRFCKNCGKPLGETAKFCRRCGTPLEPAVSAASDKAGNGNPPGYAPNSSRTPKKLPDSARPFSNTAETSATGGDYINAGTGTAAAGKRGGAARKRSAALKATALVAAAVIIFAAVMNIKECGGIGKLWNGITSSGNPIQYGINISYSDADYGRADSSFAKVSPHAPSAEAGGVTVDFGNYNLKGESTLEIKRLEPKTDDSLGLTAHLYDFSLTGEEGAQSEFFAPVSVTLPCPSAAGEIAFIEYYNRDSGTWRMIPCSRDGATGTISFQTDHFSSFAAVTSDGEVLLQIPGSIFSYVGRYNGQTTPVMITDGDIDRLLAQSNIGKLENYLRLGKIPTDDTCATALSYVNNAVSGGGALIDEDLNLTKYSRSFTKESMEKLNPAMTAVGTALLMCKIGYHIYKGVNLADIVKDNAFDIAESALSIAALYTGAAPLAFAAAGVFAAGLAYDALDSDEPDAWDEYTYYKYCENMVYFDPDILSCRREPDYIRLDAGGENCELAIGMIYETYQNDPNALYKRLTAFFDDYTDMFWNLSRDEAEKYYRTLKNDTIIPDFIRDLYSETPENYPYPDQAAIAVFKANFRRRLFGRLKPVLSTCLERSYLALKQALLDELCQKYVPSLNQIITFEMIDLTLGGRTFDNSQYASADYFQIMFGDFTTAGFNAGGLDYSSPSDHIFKCEKNSNKVYQCSLFAYMAQGYPNTVDVYGVNSNSIMTFPFTCSLPTTEIPLIGRPKTADAALKESRILCVEIPTSDIESSAYFKEKGASVSYKLKIKFPASGYTYDAELGGGKRYSEIDIGEGGDLSGNINKAVLAGEENLEITYAVNIKFKDGGTLQSLDSETTKLMLNANFNWAGTWKRSETYEDSIPDILYRSADPTYVPSGATTTVEDIFIIAPYKTEITSGGQKVSVSYKITQKYIKKTVYGNGKSDESEDVKQFLGIAAGTDILTALKYDGQNESSVNADSFYYYFSIKDKNTISIQGGLEYARYAG